MLQFQDMYSISQQREFIVPERENVVIGINVEGKMKASPLKLLTVRLKT